MGEGKSIYWSRFVKDLSPYRPGEQPGKENVIKLNTNESPFGPSPSVLRAVQAVLNDDLRLYPTPNGNPLREKISNYYGLSERQVFLGNGSDEVLAHAFNCFFRKDKPILFPEITYSFYSVFCKLYGIKNKKISLTQNLKINLEDYYIANGGIIFPNPNAPTGTLLSLDNIRCLLEFNTESVVIIDEAYIDFGGVSALPLLKNYKNMLIIHTLSKSRALAGMRIGYALGSDELIDGLYRVKNSFNSYPTSRLQIAAAIASFKDEDYFQDSIKKIKKGRDALSKGLQVLGFAVTPSFGNFLLVAHADHGAFSIWKRLRQDGILVRHFDQYPISNHLRISVGNEVQNRALLEALREICGTDTN
ncbi:MAG: histidinol-phosphate transaminase [Cellvibrionales bacterium TMED49]|nr:histidinol-phosphate transaminase [Porticoccaceae bacterium]OUU40810.1 MAG: histidinol-phosphate transaminase [Cellvibrionales bacterium TMED49]|tara:strand:- start:2475 stop:3557 length:1083 start_codon:yes stop_codon:yes gene_type:complete